MLRYIVSKIVQEIVNSSPNKRYVDALPEDLKQAYQDDDNDGVINYLDKDVDLETRSEWRKRFMEYNSKLSSSRNSLDNSKIDSVYNKLDTEVLSSNLSTVVRGIVFVAVIGYIVISLILKS